MKRNHLIILMVLLALGQQNLSAQSHIISTKSVHGGVFLGDSEEYTYNLSDKEYYRIEYDCFHSFKDSPEEGIKDKKYLQIGSSTSKFLSKIHFQMDSAALYTPDRMNYSSIKDLHKMDPVYVYECYFIDHSSRKLTFTNRLEQDDFLYEEDLPDISWEIFADSTITVCGFECTKAMGTFRGRTFLAWFTLAIPSPSGPWKLGGLPGAILKAEDLEHRCSFEAVSVWEASKDIAMAEYPYYKVSKRKYLDLLKLRILKPVTFAVAHSNRNPFMKVKASAPDKPQREMCDLEIE